MRGRPPKPTSQQIAEGDPRKKGVRKLRQQLEAEPKAQSGLPECPRHLSGRAKKAWTFWKIELEVMKLDCRPDAMMLEGACVNYARAVEADIEIALDGISLRTPLLDRRGEVVGVEVRTHPAVKVSNASWRNVRAFCSEFGLSPVSRTRLAIEKSDTSDKDLLSLLTQPRAKSAGPQVQ